MPNPKLNPKTLPKLEDLHPPYRALIEKRTEMRELRADIDNRMRALAEQLRTTQSHTTGASAPSPMARRAAELLGQPLPDLPEKPTIDWTDYRALEGERNAVDEALRQLEQRIRREGVVASGLLCAEIEQPWSELMGRLIRHSLGAYEAALELTVLTDHFRWSDISFASLNPVFPNFIEIYPTSLASQFLWSLVEAGWIKRSDLPENLRK